MLGIDNQLLFPRLVHLKQSVIKGKGWQKQVGLYKLDWSLPTKVKKSKFESWLNKNYPDFADTEWPGEVPDQYNIYLDNLIFALDSDAIDEIHRNCQCALVEWNTRRPFDTVIADMCRKTAVTHSQVAFKLLCDYIYDEKEESFSRNSMKYVSSYIMLMKFWMYQTGTGLILEFSDIQTLAWLAGNSKTVKDTAREVMGNMKKHLDEMQDVYSKITTVSEDEEEDKPKPKSKKKAKAKKVPYARRARKKKGK